MPERHGWTLLLTSALLGACVPATVWAQTAAYKQLSGEWWQWALSIPQPTNPLLDSTGEHCMVGQRGDTWFLAGTLGGAASRSCTVPEGAVLFVPVVNQVVFDTPNCFQGPDPIPAQEWRKLAAAAIDGVTNVSATLDGQPLAQLHRVQSEVFHLALPQDNLFAPFVPPSPDCPAGLPAGIYSPAVDDGIYVRLGPLATGAHTLHFHAENPSASFELDVTYSLTVVPVLRR